ncbi:MAG: hypothetical protein PSX81_04185 [bacterium]|nr:hypothetical protein [bacterium]
MKSFTISICIFCLLTACNETYQLQDTSHLDIADTISIGQQTYTIEPTSEKDFNAIKMDEADTSEKKNIQPDANFVHRNGDTLFLEKTDGNYVQLINCFLDDDDSFANYTYQMYLDDIDYFVVYAGFYEWYNYCLINRETGKITYTCGSPVVSPTNQWLMAGNCDLIAQFTFNGFELFKIEKNDLKLIASKALNNWGPEKIKWTKSNELLVQQSIFDSTSTTETKTAYIKLKAKQ